MTATAEMRFVTRTVRPRRPRQARRPAPSVCRWSAGPEHLGPLTAFHRGNPFPICAEHQQAILDAPGRGFSVSA